MYEIDPTLKSLHFKRGWICRIANKDTICHISENTTLCIVIANNRISGNKAPNVIYLYPDEIKTQPTHIDIQVQGNPMIAKCEYIQAIDNSRFLNLVDKITFEEKENLNQGLLLSLGLNSGINPNGIFSKWKRYTEAYSLFDQTAKNKNCQQFDIFYIKENPNELAVGHEIWPDRPAIIVSNNIINQYSPRVNAIYLTTADKNKNLKTHASVTSHGMPATALCEQIVSIEKSQLQNQLGSLGKTDSEALIQAILYSLQLTMDMKPKEQFKNWETYLKEHKFFK